MKLMIVIKALRMTVSVQITRNQAWTLARLEACHWSAGATGWPC
jgi:hypothetical protein